MALITTRVTNVPRTVSTSFRNSMFLWPTVLYIKSLFRFIAFGSIASLVLLRKL